MRTDTDSEPAGNPQLGPASAEPPDDSRATPDETRAELLKRTGRGYTVVRHVLVQQPNSELERPSVLGPMVTQRKRRSLQLYLLLLTAQGFLESREENGEPPLPAAVWARALSTEKGRKWTPTHVSAAWGDLEQRGLIERQRLPHGVVVKPRREDGRADYTKPGQKKADRWETYFVLPPEFWTDGWFEKLSLPGLAMLLIVAAETSSESEVWLSNETTAEWYGMSARSVEAGLKDLENNGLVHERTEWIKSPLSAIGATVRHWYSLTGPFSTEERNRMRGAAKTEHSVRARAATTGNRAPAAPTKKPKKLKKRAAQNRTSDTAGKAATHD